MVMDLANVSQEVATAALDEHKEVWLAIDALITRPTTVGDRFVPPPPEIDHGLTREQEALCRRGRWLQDQVNAVFSVAHSKIRTLPDQDLQALEDAAPPVEIQELDHEQLPPSTTAPEQDSPERTAQPVQQSEALQ
jgi:hypothetical protein